MAVLPLDRFVPAPDVRERFETTVRAPSALVLDVATGFDLHSLRSVRAIFRLRELLLRSEPDQVKLAWAREVTEVAPDVSRLAQETRAVATDAAARAKFLRHWRWAHFGIVAIRLLMLPAVRREAERRWAMEQGSVARR